MARNFKKLIDTLYSLGMRNSLKVVCNSRLPFIIVFVFLSIITFAQKGLKNDNNLRLSFPIGGIGSGMFCLEGTGSIGSLSLHNNPELYNEPVMFASVYIREKGVKVIEGQIPNWKRFGQLGSAMGAEEHTYGLARFTTNTFKARFPFGTVNLTDDRLPVTATITGWSPFIPTDADNSSLPVGALEYTLTNISQQIQRGVFSYNAKNVMAQEEGENSIKQTSNGFILSQTATHKRPEAQGDLAIWTDQPSTTVDACWFRGGWVDPLTMAWKNIQNGDTKAVAPVKNDAPGASLYIPFTLKPGGSRTIKVYFAWYVPFSNIRYGVRSNRSSDTTSNPMDKQQPSDSYMPWYANKFKNISEVLVYWQTNYDKLKHDTQLFTNAFYSSTLPPVVLEAVAANLSILKSPTTMRQYDGRFWAWEGSDDYTGSCAGNCNHVYNYAQALCHLFPALERTVRETELNEGMDAYGHMNYRMAVPIRPEGHDIFLPAADGQLGSIMRTYRDWRISGDNIWIEKLYPKLKTSLDYCISTWDPGHTGTLIEPHHNTYDIEFWGADGYSTSYYLGALEAFIQISEAFKRSTTTTTDLSFYQNLFNKGKQQLETKLYNGQYFVQDIQWRGLHNNPLIYHNTAEGPKQPLSPEAATLLELEGPSHQYGKGCLSDGVIGDWMAKVCDLPDFIDEQKVKSHLSEVYQNNFKTDLSGFSNPQRSTYALGHEGGLLLCSWPQGNALSLPFPYSNEVWTGIEYEVAAHLIMEGKVKEGLNIVKTTRKRYDGTVRNPFDEYECGHWYARALSSYSLLQALTGVRYDAVTKTLYVKSQIGDFTSFLSTNTGFGNVIYKHGRAKIKVAYGTIDVQNIQIDRS